MSLVLFSCTYIINLTKSCEKVLDSVRLFCSGTQVIHSIYWLLYVRLISSVWNILYVLLVFKRTGFFRSELVYNRYI